MQTVQLQVSRTVVDCSVPTRRGFRGSSCNQQNITAERPISVAPVCWCMRERSVICSLSLFPEWSGQLTSMCRTTGVDLNVRPLTVTAALMSEPR